MSDDDNDNCPLCGGCGEVDVTFQDHHRDVTACPICLTADKDAEIERLTRERDEARENADRYLANNITLTAKANLLRDAVSWFLAHSVHEKLGHVPQWMDGAMHVHSSTNEQNRRE